jgi:hypothetical protein
MDFEKQKKILRRIKKAYDYVEANQGNNKALAMANDRFEKEILPECKKVGIEEHFAWGLMYFGGQFIKDEFAGRSKL